MTFGDRRPVAANRHRFEEALQRLDEIEDERLAGARIVTGQGMEGWGIQ
jgi:hypothetical protein